MGGGEAEGGWEWGGACESYDLTDQGDDPAGAISGLAINPVAPLPCVCARAVSPTPAE